MSSFENDPDVPLLVSTYNSLDRLLALVPHSKPTSLGVSEAPEYVADRVAPACPIPVASAVVTVGSSPPAPPPDPLQLPLKTALENSKNLFEVPVTVTLYTIL